MMMITTAAGAREAVGWPGAFGWAAFCAMIAAIIWAVVWHDVQRARENKP